MIRAPRRVGSIALLAFLVIFVLFTVIIAYHFSSISTQKMFHHTYYSEKSLSIIDGLTLIARGVVQQNLDVIIEKLEVGQESDLKGLLEDGGTLTSKVKEMAEKVRFLHGEDYQGPDRIEPAIDAKVVVLDKEAINQRDSYETIRPDNQEIHGRLGIVIEVGFENQFTVGARFKVPTKVVRTEYEFKKLRAVPPFFRHFNLFVKNAIPNEENYKDYADLSANFNDLSVDKAGDDAASGGALFLENGPGIGENDFPEASGENPFKSQIPYVYLGSGKTNNTAYLNITQGGGYMFQDQVRNMYTSKYGEGFMLYRGRRTHFYRMLTTEFANFIENAPKIGETAGAPAPGAGGGFLATLKRMFNSVVDGVKNFFTKTIGIMNTLHNFEADQAKAQSLALPLYYIVRKDYGFAKDWGETADFTKYGMKQGDVKATSLHLWNRAYRDGQRPTPTLILGRVYRRCLSLAGYKQSRGLKDQSLKRKFEVQAGPIEYFPDLESLFSRTSDWTKSPDAGGPLWTYDSRVWWESPQKVDSGEGPVKEIQGNYIPISGPALFGRLVPGFTRLRNQEEQIAETLFRASVNPPAKLGGSKEEGDQSVTANNLDTDAGDLISPLFPLYDSSGGFDPLKDEAEVTQRLKKGLLFGDLDGENNSPYYEEVFRSFLYSCVGLPEDERSKLSANQKSLVNKAADAWNQVVIKVNSDTAVQANVQRLDPGSIADPKYKPLWQTGQADAQRRGIYPFSLPDPWSDHGPLKVANNFEAQFRSAVGDTEGFYDKYFRPVMTNPARVVPYNYSMRFWLIQLHNLFTIEGEDRIAKIKGTIPEIRDGAFGHLKTQAGEELNPYMRPDPKDPNVPALDDDVLEKIYDARQGNADLENAYFFMDEYAGKARAPRDVDLADIFKGDYRYCWEEMDQSQFENRFVTGGGTEGGDNLKQVALGTVVRVKDGFSLGGVNVIGGGAIIAEKGALVISGPITAQGESPLFLIADSIQIGPECPIIQAVLVNRGDEFSLGGSSDLVIHGALYAGGWDPKSVGGDSGSQRRLVFDPTLKNHPVDKPPYLYNLEPKPHRYVFKAKE